MSYQTERPPKATYSGNDFIPLSCEKELLEIREDIERGVNHKGRNFEICYAAISELYNKMGKHKPAADCSNCTVLWNTLLQNWFKKLDQDVRPREAMSKTEPKPLEVLAEVDGVEYTKEDLNDTWKPIGIENNPTLSKEDKIAHLQQECKEKGIEFRHNAGIKKLTELLGR